MLSLSLCSSSVMMWEAEISASLRCPLLPKVVSRKDVQDTSAVRFGEERKRPPAGGTVRSGSYGTSKIRVQGCLGTKPIIPLFFGKKLLTEPQKTSII